MKPSPSAWDTPLYPSQVRPHPPLDLRARAVEMKFDWINWRWVSLSLYLPLSLSLSVGGMILAADYSQLELRVLAHLSKDRRLLQVRRRTHKQSDRNADRTPCGQQNGPHLMHSLCLSFSVSLCLLLCFLSMSLSLSLSVSLWHVCVSQVLNGGVDVFRCIAAEWKNITPDAVKDGLRQQAKQVGWGGGASKASWLITKSKRLGEADWPINKCSLHEGVPLTNQQNPQMWQVTSWQVMNVC